MNELSTAWNKEKNSKLGENNWQKKAEPLPGKRRKRAFRTDILLTG